MEQAYKKSLKIIKKLNIKSFNEYNKYVDKYLILNVKSLKFMANKRCFKDIVKIAKEVN